MRQVTNLSRGEGLYKCRIILDSVTGKISAAKDFSCPAGSRGYCKHIAGLAYKLKDAVMAGERELPRTISCTGCTKKKVIQLWHVIVR